MLNTDDLTTEEILSLWLQPRSACYFDVHFGEPLQDLEVGNIGYVGSMKVVKIINKSKMLVHIRPGMDEYLHMIAYGWDTDLYAEGAKMHPDTAIVITGNEKYRLPDGKEILFTIQPIDLKKYKALKQSK